MTTDSAHDLPDRYANHFANFIGVKIISASPDKVEATLEAREEFSNRRGGLHGGALMTLADTMGGFGTTANLPPDFSTVTIESKTNFIAAIPNGTTAHAESIPLHRGRTTQVWQTRITRDDGRLAAIVTQTQLVIPPQAGAADPRPKRTAK